MQPEIKVKENGQDREFTPTEQWDQLAFQVLYRELAPKGFKKVTGGSYKGQIIAVCDGPGLPKSKVTSAQKIAAQLIRGFRDKAKKSLNDRLATIERLQNNAIRNRDACKFWQMSKARRYQNEYEHFRNQSGVVQIIINELDQISIK